jgi:hypothetical protein
MNESWFMKPRITQWLGIGALVLALILTGGGAWLGQGGSALAPEPAKLTQALTGSNGFTAQAVYSSSGAPTTVLKWSSSYIATANPPAAGTPCATSTMASGQVTTKVIQRNGIYAKCV